MKVNSEIFRAYDIRGIVDEALTEDGIFQIGKAIGSRVLAEGRSSILTARDGRISGPRLLDQFQKGVMSSGCNVVDIGEVPTPLLYFATFKTNISDGVMLTGSHNPKNYNGLKIVINKESMTSEKINKIHPNIRIVFSPEFLTEANSIEDFRKCNRIVLGGNLEDTVESSPPSTRIALVIVASTGVRTSKPMLRFGPKSSPTVVGTGASKVASLPVEELTFLLPI